QRFHVQPRTRLNRCPRRLRSRSVSRHPRQVPLLRPAAVPIHDHRDMPRQSRQVQLLQQPCLFRCNRTKGLGSQRLRMCSGVCHGQSANLLYAAKLTHPSLPAQSPVPAQLRARAPATESVPASWVSLSGLWLLGSTYLGLRVPQVPILHLGLGFLFSSSANLSVLCASALSLTLSYLCFLCVPTSVNGACPDPVGVLPSFLAVFPDRRYPSFLTYHLKLKTDNFSLPALPCNHCKIACPISTIVRIIIATAVIHATTLNASVFVCSPIKSFRFTSSRMKITTMGSHTPFPTCENIKIFHSGTFGISTIPAPTTIRIVYNQ